MVKRAALYLYKTNTGAGSYTIRRVADDWDESNVAHNVFIPADEGMETASWTIDADKDQYVSCDISSLVSTCYAEGGANLNLAIGGTVGGSSSNTTIQFQSKEGIYKPYLAVEFEERTAQADVDAALRRLTLADTAQENIKLPTVGEYETVITWASSDTAVITEDGKVTRPAVNRPDAQITLTATISKTGAESRTKQFVITVLSNATPLEDSYIDPNNPDTAYGDAAQIFAKHRPQRIIAVKYDLSGLGDLGDYAFASAKFKIYCTSTDVVPEEQVLLACSDNSWEEETLTWNTAENMRSETRIVAVGAASSAGDSWIEFDITDYANEKLLTRDKLMSFLLIATNEGEKASVYYQSKEADNKPVLEVELQPQSGMAVMYDYALNSDGTAQLTEGKLNIEAYYRNTTDADCSTRLLAAAYSSDGRMLRAFISEGAVAAAAGGGNASASLMLDTSGLSDIGYFRLFSWEGTATLRPYRQETIRVAAAS